MESKRPRPTSTYAQALRASSEEFGHLKAPSPETLDSELVQRALDGDFNAFEGLVARYERKAFWLAYQVLGQVEEARDVVQEGFIRVHRSLDRFDFSKNFYTWLYRIITNLSIDSLRKNKHKVRQLEDMAGELPSEVPHDPEVRMEGKELRLSVRTVLDGMHPRFRTILALRDLHGISCREIGPILGLTYATVRWRLHKARQLFREKWERETGLGDAEHGTDPLETES